MEGNKIIGNPELIDSNIEFSGKNNVLYCDSNVKIKNSTIKFLGDNSIVYLSSNKHYYYFDISIYNNSVLYLGKNNYINSNLNMIVSEEKNIFIGNDCLFSNDIWFRTADPHLIFDVNTKKRINYSKSIYIGDHVWIGQASMLLKGSKIYSGSIIGAGAVVSGKKIESNSIWGGNPVRKIKDNIFWDFDCVHLWTKSKTLENKERVTNKYIYSGNNVLSFDKIEEKLNEFDNLNLKLEYLKEMSYSKNRFSYKIEKKKLLKSFRKRLGKIKRKILKNK